MRRLLTILLALICACAAAFSLPGDDPYPPGNPPDPIYWQSTNEFGVIFKGSDGSIFVPVDSTNIVYVSYTNIVYLPPSNTVTTVKFRDTITKEPLIIFTATTPRMEAYVEWEVAEQ